MTAPSTRTRPCSACGTQIPHVSHRPKCLACYRARKPSRAQLYDEAMRREQSAYVNALQHAMTIAAELLGVTYLELEELGMMREYAIQARREDIARRYHYGRAIPGPEVEA